MADFFWFSDAQWARIAPLLPRARRGKLRVGDQRVLTPYEYIYKCWTNESERFSLNPHHQIPGPNTQARVRR